MKALKKIIVSVYLAILTCVSVYSQITTTVVYSFRIVNDYSKSLTCKQFFKADNIKDETTSYVKVIFQDQDIPNDNGYILLSSEDDLKMFISDLEVMISKINTEEVVTITRYQYTFDINNPVNSRRFQKNLNKKVCIYEPNSNTFIGFKKEKLQQLVANLKKINWQ